MASRSRRLISLLTCATIVATLLALTPAPAARADPTTPFAIRTAFNDNGAIALVGNNLLSCPSTATGCTAARQGTGGQLNDNNFVMANVDADSDASTFNSSNSQLVLPSGSSVLWAGLYWGARLDGGSGGHVAPSRTLRTQMALRGPTDSGYQTVASSVEFGPNESSSDAYQEFADVTSIVQPQGAGAWWGANVQSGTGEDRYAGWTLVVVYRNAGLPLRNLTVFDGFNYVSQGNPQTITISGFLAPRTGPVQGQFGMVAYEGDLGQAGDSATLTSGTKSTQLATGLSSGSNFFNSSNDFNGANVTTRVPADRNMFGYDIKNFGGPNAVPNGATSATITLGTTNDTYFPGVVSTTIDLFAPDFTSSVKTVTNLSGNDPAGPGDTLQYTVNLTNTGGDPATGGVLTDVLPPNTSYVPGSLSVVDGPNGGAKTDSGGDDQAEYLAATRTVRFRLGAGASSAAGGTIGVDASTAVAFQVMVNAAAAGSTLTNQAALSYTAATLGQGFTYITNPATTRVVPNADLVVTKTADTAVTAGQNATSTITVTNRGPNTAQNVELTDTLPAGATFVSTAPTALTCSHTGPVVSCSLGDLANGATATVTVLVRIPSGSTDSSVTDVATATSDTNDPTPANNTAGATTGVDSSADLSISKTADPGTVAPGETITFPITVRNNGPSDARSVTVSDQLDPSRLVPVSIDHPDVCRLSAAALNCSLTSLAAGDSFVVNLVARVPPDFTGTSVSNTAATDSQTPDPLPGNNSVTATVTVGVPRADLSIGKTASPTTVPAGGQVTYVLTVTNPAGPSVATGLRITDALPQGLIAVQAVASDGSCDIGPAVTCLVDRLAVGDSVTVTITVAVSPDAALGTITNSAAVQALGSTDPDTSDNTDSAAITIVGQADVAIHKAGTGAPVAGEPLSYTLTAANNGPSRARGITVTDTLPDSLTDIGVPTGCTVTGQTVACTEAELAVNATTSFTITATVAPTFPGGDISNTATVATDGTTDPSAADNRATFVSTASAAADLAITKTAPATATAGGTIAFDVAVSNTGPSAAADTTVTDPMPAGLTAISAADGCTLGATVSCNLGTVDAGETVRVTITARIDPGIAGGAVVTNTARVSATTTDPSDANNSARFSTTIITSADISVIKTLVTPTTPPLAPGQSLQFRILVHNDGPSDAHGLQLRDSTGLLAGDFVEISEDGDAMIDDCVVTATVGVTCELPDLAAGATTDVEIVFTSDPGAGLDPTTYANTASVSAVTADPNPADNTGSASFGFGRSEADLALSKTGQVQLVAGTAFSYAITVDDTAGPSDAQDVVVTDPLPAGLLAAQAQATQGSCTIAARVVTCRLGTIARMNFPPVITVSGTVAGDAPAGPVTNVATLTTSTPDPDTDNNTADFDSVISRQANLSLTKTADTDPLIAGTTVGYTLTVTDAGPSDAGEVTLTDVLPAAIAFDPAADPRCSQTTTVTCALGTIPAGTTVVVRVSGQLDSSYPGGSLTNTASVSSAGTDPEPGDDSATLTSVVVQQADLSVTKLATPSNAAAGTDVEYPISVINNGPSDAVDASFTDPLPLPPTSFVLPSQGDVTCRVDGLTVVCTAPRLKPGQSRTGQITVHLPADQPAGVLSNTATVGADTPDPNTSNNAMTAPVDVQLIADLSLTKRIVTNPVLAGAPVTFALDVTNHGPSIAPDASITDPLPADVAFVSASAGCQATPSDTGTVVVGCSLGTLAVGDTAHATVTVRPPPDAAAGELINTADDGSRAQDPAPADNVATAAAVIGGRADLAITLTGPATVTPGGQAVLHLHYADRGPSDATGVMITATLPPELTPTAPARCTVAGHDITCAVGNLDAGDDGSIEIPVTVGVSVPAGTRLTANVAIAGTPPDPNPDNDASSTSLLVAIPATDVGVVVTADGPTVRPGEVAGYLVSVTNHGPAPARGVVLVNTLPALVTHPQDPPACSFAGNTATCTVGELAVGEVVSIPFRGTVPDTVDVGSVLVDSAGVSHAGADAEPGNDRAGARITVAAASGQPTSTSPATSPPASPSTSLSTSPATSPTGTSEAPPTTTGPTGPSLPGTPATTAGSPSTIANTGLDVAGLLGLGMALLTIGAGLALMSRHRRRA